MYAFIAINFSLSTAFTASYKFWYVMLLFSFISKYFIISLVISSLTHWLFKSLLFNFNEFPYFPVSLHY